MIKYIYAKELKENYSVYGSFYNIYQEGDEIAQCRNNLEIYNINCFEASENNRMILKLKEKPDALAIMMNPGSSRPLSNECVETCYELEGLENNIIKNKMVLAKPDITQYQIMRIMNEKKWAYVRVVNLSDIRCANSKDFFNEVKEFELKFESTVHSIFSDSRKNELNKAFNIKNEAPVILAWGCNNDKFQMELAKRAFDQMNKLGYINFKGLKHDRSEYLYYHPLPRGKKNAKWWFDNMCSKLNINRKREFD